MNSFFFYFKIVKIYLLFCLCLDIIFSFSNFNSSLDTDGLGSARTKENLVLMQKKLKNR